MRILVTGSREWTDREALIDALSDLSKECMGDCTLIHGGAYGADILAHKVVRAWAARWGGWATEIFPAEWAKDGKAAGPIRNARMLEEGKPDICLAFPLPGSKGTWDMIRKANAAGIEVRIIPARRSDEVEQQLTLG